MDRPRPSVITALFWAYWDLCHVLRTAWRPALFAFLVLSFGSFAALVAPRLLTYDPAGQAVMRLAVLVGICFLLTPFFLAVHRLLIRRGGNAIRVQTVEPALSVVLRLAR